jgi:hypothetical protein
MDATVPLAGKPEQHGKKRLSCFHEISPTSV